MIITIVFYFIYPGAPKGITTLIVLVLFIGGIQLLSISILSEYIGKILEETKKRPHFIIKKIIKLVFTIGVFLVLYVVYLNYTDQEVPQNLEELKESVAGSVEKAKNVASESLEDVKESTKNIVEEKVEKKVNEVFGD